MPTRRSWSGGPETAALRPGWPSEIVLLAVDGLTGPQIAVRVGCAEPTVIKWRRRYGEHGLAGLQEAPRPGGPATVLTDDAGCRAPK